MTKDNLLKRGIEKPKECMFCLEEESISHLFFDCVVAKILWNLFSDFYDLTVSCYADVAGRYG